jgi:hypothetical protein
MAQFPQLKTGAIAQYPLERWRFSSTRVLRFLDGSEQRLSFYKAPLRRWLIRLDLLDEGELAAIESFVRENGGRAESFAFTDPLDGTVRPNCRLESDEIAFESQGFDRGRVTVAIQERR